MNKKANTVFFVLGATIVNVIIMIVIAGALLLLYGRFAAPHLSPQATSIFFVVIFIGSIVLTYFIYHKLINYLIARVDMEKYFDPIFRPRKK